MNIHTLIVITANLLFSMRGFKDYSFFEQYKFNIAALQRGEKIRMLSSGFLHVNWQHFMFNMISLYFFAHIVVNLLGALIFIWFIFLVYLQEIFCRSIFTKTNLFIVLLGQVEW